MKNALMKEQDFLIIVMLMLINMVMIKEEYIQSIKQQG
jgi:hypothetical protein